MGKTSCCFHLAGAFAARGLRVLLVDNDPQSSLSQGLFGPDAVRAMDPAETVAALYGGDLPFPAAVIRPSGHAGIDILPGSKAAADWNVPRPERADPDAQECLRSFLFYVMGYDLCLIDCPPNLHLCSWAALLASEALVVPLQPEDYGAQGVADVQESIARVQAGPNPDLRLLGYLLTRMGARKSIHRHFDERLRAAYGDDVFAHPVPDLVAFVEAIAFRTPVERYAPRSAAARAIRAVAAEFLDRAAAIRPTLAAAEVI